MTVRQSQRRVASMTLSSRIVDYLVAQGRTQAEVARLLGVSQGYVSLVRSRERALTLDHLEALALGLDIPLGAMLLAATKSDAAKPQSELSKHLERVIHLADDATAIIRKTQAAKGGAK